MSPGARARRSRRRGAGFFLGFFLVALVVAGGLSYFASAQPDGLDRVTLHGCQVTSSAEGTRLEGSCIARQARQNASNEAAGSLATSSPLAGYTISGGAATVGPAGVIGVLVTLVLAGGLFRLLRRTCARSTRD